MTKNPKIYKSIVHRRSRRELFLKYVKTRLLDKRFTMCTYYMKNCDNFGTLSTKACHHLQQHFQLSCICMCIYVRNVCQISTL